jgi:hypothetical protein
VYLALAVVWHAPSSLSPSDTLPDLGDPLHLAYVMAWDARQLVRDPLALYESNSFYPYRGSLLFGDHLLPEAVLVAPVNWWTGNAVLASNVGVLLALWLSGLTMFVLVRWATGSWGGGLVAGAVYGFNSFTRHELLRVHVLNVEWWPLGLLFLLRWVGTRRLRDALGLSGALALQGLSGAYYLVCTALLTPPWIALAYVLARRRPAAAELARLGLALAACALPAAAVLWPYLLHMHSMGFEKALADGADLVCYAQPPRGSLIWGGLKLSSSCFGLPHFLGFAALALMACGSWQVVRRRLVGPPRALGWLAIATAGAGLVLSMGPLLQVAGVRVAPGPFAALHAWVPLVRGMDGSKRMGVLVVLGGAILAGLGSARLLERRFPRRRAAAALAAALALPLEHWTPPSGDAVPAGPAVPEAYRVLAAGRSPLVELPLLPELSKRLWSSYLHFSTAHWRPVPIGRTSFYPPAHDFLAAGLAGFPDPASLTLLARLRIDTLLVHPRVWSDGERGARLAALDAEPRLRLLRSFGGEDTRGGAALGLGQERLYVLAGGPPAVEPLCAPRDEVPREAWSLRSLATGRPASRATGRFEDWVRQREWRVPWRADWAHDGDRRTAWTTAGGQRPGDGLELRFARRQAVAAIELALGYPFDEFPRELIVVADRHGAARERLRWEDGPEWRWETLRSLLDEPRRARSIVRFPVRELESLTLRIGGREAEDEVPPRWSVPELRVFAACR